MRSLVYWCGAAVLGLAASTAVAQDVVTNGHFDSNVAGWTHAGGGTLSWDPLDWRAQPTSGSARVSNTFGGSNINTGAGECIALASAGTYELDGKVRFPSGQASSGTASVGVSWYSNATCTNPPTASTNTALVNSTTTGTWVDLVHATVTIPAGTQSVKVTLNVAKASAGGSLEALFDRVRFGLAGTLPVNQDLVANGHFHSDVVGWTHAGGGALAWEPLDWQAQPTSGSARVSNTFGGSNITTGAGQCIPVAALGTYELGGKLRFPSGQASSGSAYVGAAWYSNATCTNPPTGSTNTALVSSATTDTWVDVLNGSVAIPASAQSLKVTLSVAKSSAGGSLEALFDRVRFGLVGTTPVELQDFSVE